MDQFRRKSIDLLKEGQGLKIDFVGRHIPNNGLCLSIHRPPHDPAQVLYIFTQNGDKLIHLCRLYFPGNSLRTGQQKTRDYKSI